MGREQNLVLYHESPEVTLPWRPGSTESDPLASHETNDRSYHTIQA